MVPVVPVVVVMVVIAVGVVVTVAAVAAVPAAFVAAAAPAGNAVGERWRAQGGRPCSIEIGHSDLRGHLGRSPPGRPFIFTVPYARPCSLAVR